MIYQPGKWKGSLCWCCRNAYDGCAWSRDGEAVEGWKAVRNDLPPQTRGCAPVKSFCVLECPEFLMERRFEAEFRKFRAAEREGLCG